MVVVQWWAYKLILWSWFLSYNHACGSAMGLYYKLVLSSYKPYHDFFCLFPAQIMQEIKENDVQIYTFPTDDQTVSELNKKMNVSRTKVEFRYFLSSSCGKGRACQVLWWTTLGHHWGTKDAAQAHPIWFVLRDVQIYQVVFNPSNNLLFYFLFFFLVISWLWFFFYLLVFAILFTVQENQDLSYCYCFFSFSRICCRLLLLAAARKSKWTGRKSEHAFIRGEQLKVRRNKLHSCLATDHSCRSLKLTCLLPTLPFSSLCFLKEDAHSWITLAMAAPSWNGSHRWQHLSKVPLASVAGPNTVVHVHLFFLSIFSLHLTQNAFLLLSESALSHFFLL